MSKEEAKINQEMLMLSKDEVPRIGSSLSQDEPRRLMVVGIKPNIPDLNVTPCYDSKGEEIGETIETIQSLAGLKAQDGSYIDPKLMHELKVEIFTRFTCFQYWKLLFLSKRLSQLLKSREIFRMRRERGLAKPYVILHSGGKTSWTMFDKYFENFRRLPQIPSDQCFFNNDKETISVGTQVIVIGRDVEGIVVWRYELENHKWFKGPSMFTPRVMYGSASNGTHAFFAGGIHIDETRSFVVVNAAEKYNAETKMWTVVHGMHKRRKFSSGCFLGGKFYVLGGRDENDEYLTCGERYDEVTNSWELIPDMLKDMRFMSFQCPPLIAVVDDNLYLLETSLNELRVYDVNANAWKKLGVVPVKANAGMGWGVAFKSIGDRLLVVGPSAFHSWTREIVYYTCRPYPDAKEQRWEILRHCCEGVQIHEFIQNCCVMFA